MSRRLRPAVALFFLAPLVGEFLLGNQPVTQLPGLVLLAPLYGGGALLVRETVRRAGWGAPSMVLLAAAYALVEEGPVDEMLWNPHYGGFDMGSAYAATHVPLLGTSVAMLQDVLSMHTVWSICVPIVLVETFTADPRRPWLGRIGLPFVAVLFGVAAVFLALTQVQSEHFVASPGQFAWVAVAILALVGAAIAVGRRTRPPRPAGAPRTRRVAATAFAAASLYWLLHDFLLSAGVLAWVPVTAWFVLVAGIVACCARWSRGRGWGPAHRLALARGALLTYVWLGFLHSLEMGVPYVIALPGDAVFAIAAIVLLRAASRAVSGRAEQVYGSATEGKSRGVDLAKLLDEMTPYVVSAVGAYGKSVLAKERAASLTVGVGLGLTQRVFGKREEDDDELPDALAKVVEHPNDPAYVNALRNLMRDKLKDDSAMADDVKKIIAEAEEARGKATSKGDRTTDIHAKARTITTGGTRQKQ